MMNAEEKLNILLRVGKEISRERDLDRLLETLTNLARDILDSERCSIFLYDYRSNFQ